MKLALIVVLSGVLAAADPLVLDRVEMYRATYQGAELAGAGVVKLGVEDCALLGWRGTVYVEGVGALPAHVTDCQSEHDRAAFPMSGRGLVADVDRPELNGKQAVVVLRPPGSTLQ